MISEEQWIGIETAAFAFPECKPTERNIWLTRNMSELAMYLIASDDGPERLDAAVYKSGIGSAPRPFVTRLQRAREMWGVVPSFYPVVGPSPEPEATSESYSAAALVICEFADHLADIEGEERLAAGDSPMLGVGRSAILARNGSRVSFIEDDFEFIELDEIPSGIVRRSWLTLSKPTILVTPQNIGSDKIDIWWGLHNGCHVDHLTWMGDETPTLCEFGSGLLIAEALAMFSEILAGSMARFEANRTTAQTVRSGLIERAGRLPLDATRGSGAAYSQASNLELNEFALLPTVSSAYVEGPLQLIGRDFRSPSIPKALAEKLRSVTANQMEVCPAFANLTRKARALYGIRTHLTGKTIAV